MMKPWNVWVSISMIMRCGSDPTPFLLSVKRITAHPSHFLPAELVMSNSSFSPFPKFYKNTKNKLESWSELENEKAAGKLELEPRAGKIFQFHQILEPTKTAGKFDNSQNFNYNILIKNERVLKIITEKDNSKMKPTAARKLQKGENLWIL